MTYIPDCRTDEAYNESKLDNEGKEFIAGFDFGMDAADNCFDNLDAFDFDIDVRPSDIETVAKAIRNAVKTWMESRRNEAIVSMLDEMMCEENK